MSCRVDVVAGGVEIAAAGCRDRPAQMRVPAHQRSERVRADHVEHVQGVLDQHQAGVGRVVIHQRSCPFHPRLHGKIRPTFAASELCGADADLIVDGVLIELKTRLGSANRKSGQRSDSLSLADIYQVVGYTLFDTTNAFGIHTVALYSARFGALHRWPVQQMLDSVAGGPVDIAAERAKVWKLLAADNQRSAV